MEFALDKILAISQEGTVKEYCVSFQILFDQVQNLIEISEIYAIYLFIYGLEPEIREIFVEWHQYSCFKLKDVMSLALKIDSHGLQDSFSPFDPTSSLYKKDLEFDLKKEENKAAFSVGVKDMDVIEDTKSDSQEISKELEEETTVVVKPVVVGEDINEDCGDVRGSPVLMQNKYDFVLKFSDKMLLGWSSITKSMETTNFEQKQNHGSTDVFENQLRGPLEKKFGCKGVGREVYYEDDYPWDPGITRGNFSKQHLEDKVCFGGGSNDMNQKVRGLSVVFVN